VSQNVWQDLLLFTRVAKESANLVKVHAQHALMGYQLSAHLAQTAHFSSFLAANVLALVLSVQTQT